MKVLRFVLRYSKRTLAVAIVCGVISGICSTGLLAIINIALHNGSSPFIKTSYLFMALALVVPVTRGLSEISLIFLSQGTLYQLRTELSQKVLKIPLRDLERIGPDRIIATLTEDLPNISAFISLVPLFSINLATTLSCLAYLGFLAFHFLLIILGFLVVGVLSYQFPVLRAIGNLRAARREQDILLHHFQSLLRGAKELKLHRGRRTAFMNDLLMATAANLRKRSIRGFTIYTLASTWGQFLAFIAVGVLASRMFSFAHADDKTLTGFVLVLFYLIGPLQVMMDVVPLVGRANVSAANIDQIGLTLDSIGIENEGGPETRNQYHWESLEAVEVTYTYSTERAEKFILGPINLKLEPGTIIFIAGGNGSGKTTLAKLLVGLYSPESGEIIFCGEKVTDA